MDIMNILESKNIKRVVITLIVIFGIIFVIVGERPRHKAGVKDSSIKPAPKVSTTEQAQQDHKKAKTAPKSSTAEPESSKKTSQPLKAQEPSDPHNKLLAGIDGKKLIAEKYTNTDHTIMEQAIQDRNEKNSIEQLEAKDDTDVNLSEQGLAEVAMELPISKANKSEIQSKEHSSPEPVKSLLELEDPRVDTEKGINPAIQKERDLEEKYPQRYETNTIAGENTIFAIDTTTANVYLLKDGEDKWTNLGKPETATTQPKRTYALEGVTTSSAVVMDTITAESWRVQIDDDTPEWSVIKPFPND